MTITVLDAAEQEVVVNLPPPPGRGAAEASVPVAISTEDKAALDDAVTAMEAVQAAVEGTLAINIAEVGGSPPSTAAANVALETDGIYQGQSLLAPKWAAISASSSGNNTLVSAVTDKKIRVLALVLVSAGTATVRLESGADGAALTGQMALVANTGFVLPFNPVGWCQTAASALLNLELSGAVSVAGALVYVEVD